MTTPLALFFAATMLLGATPADDARTDLKAGYELVEAGKHKDALEKLEAAWAKVRKVKREDDLRGVIAKYMGITLRHLKRDRAAIPWFKRALKLIPMDYEPTADLAVLLKKRNTCSASAGKVKAPKAKRYTGWLALSKAWVRAHKLKEFVHKDDLPTDEESAREWICQGCDEHPERTMFPVAIETTAAGVVGLAEVAKDGSLLVYGPFEKTGGGRCPLVEAEVEVRRTTPKVHVVRVTRIEGDMYSSSFEDPGGYGTGCLHTAVKTRVMVLPRTKKRRRVPQLTHSVTLASPGVFDDLRAKLLPLVGAWVPKGQRANARACGRSFRLSF